jgi:hypothetical protein
VCVSACVSSKQGLIIDCTEPLDRICLMETIPELNAVVVASQSRYMSLITPIRTNNRYLLVCTRPDLITRHEPTVVAGSCAAVPPCTVILLTLAYRPWCHPDVVGRSGLRIRVLYQRQDPHPVRLCRRLRGLAAGL